MLTRKSARGTALSVVFLAVASFAGCSSDSHARAALASTCTLNSDCNTDLVCTFGRCHVACITTADCQAPARCVASTADVSGAKVCLLPQESTCTYTSNCDTPLVCAVDRHCRNECVGDRDCPAGQVCSTTKSCAERAEIDAQHNLIGALSDGGTGGAPGAGGRGAGGREAGGAGGASTGGRGAGGAADVDASASVDASGVDAAPEASLGTGGVDGGAGGAGTGGAPPPKCGSAYCAANPTACGGVTDECGQLVTCGGAPCACPPTPPGGTCSQAGQTCPYTDGTYCVCNAPQWQCLAP